MEYYTLSNGVPIPAVGFGTWQMPDNDTGYDAIRYALDCGFRHIDTAQGYGNEGTVGRAVSDSGIPRSEIFLTSKLDNPNHGYQNTLSSFARTLELLRTDYVDLFLIHWPNPLQFRSIWQQTNAETWQAFESLYAAGKIRAIGISNFRRHHLDALLRTAEIMPAVNQIRLCPGDSQDALVACCRSHGILTEAYSPLGTGQVLTVPAITEIAAKYGKSPAQICIRWSLQNGFLPLPKSVTPARIRENLDVYDSTLSASAMQILPGLTGCAGAAKDPDAVPW